MNAKKEAFRRFEDALREACVERLKEFDQPYKEDTGRDLYEVMGQIADENMPEKWILYGDDREDMRKKLCFLLSDKGYAVHLAESPLEFISKSKTFQYDALITDLDYTPEGREGFEVLNQIRSLDSLKILFTGAVGFEYAAEAFEHGADYAVLEKNYYSLSEILEDELGGKNE